MPEYLVRFRDGTSKRVRADNETNARYQAMQHHNMVSGSSEHASTAISSVEKETISARKHRNTTNQL